MRTLLATWAFAPMLASAVAAQVVRVRALEEGSRRPAAGALISLREDPRRALVQALTDDVGRALLNPGRAGRFFIRLDRIGYQGATIGPVLVHAGDTLSIEITAPSTRWVLPEVHVVSGAPVVCRMEESASAAVAAVWIEARKSLVASELAQGHLPLLEVTRYERRYAPGSAIVEESSARHRTDSVIPFVAADPARLARSGYMERTGSGTAFFAPDARVLLSDEFLTQHCFRVVADSADSTRIGLAFEPAESRKHPDVAGTLWLDRTSAELRYVEFGYTGLGKRFRTGNEGGRIDFVKLPNGSPIVGKWRARVAWHERGGEVALVGPGGSLPPGATLVGRVYDSLGGGPLQGAVVSVGGGAYADTTDEAGSYRIAIPTEGDFSVNVSHPLLRLLDLPGTARSAVVIRGQEIRADFAVPSANTVAKRSCLERPVAGDSEGLLIGRIEDSAGTGQAGEVDVAWDSLTVVRPGYRISIGEGRTRVVVLSDREGRFRVCGIPAGLEVRITARVGAARTMQRATVRPGQVEIALLTLP